MALPIACPAATEVRTASHETPSIRCGVLALSNEGAHAHGFASRGQVDPVMDGEKDATTVRLFCCNDGSGDRRCGYTRCELWQAQKRADEAGRRGSGALIDGQATHVRDGYRPAVADGLAMLAERG